MRAMVLRKPGDRASRKFSLEDLACPEPEAGETLLRVLACGVCRTDLHIVQGDLPPLLPWVIPGHEIVGEVVRSSDASLAPGTKVGVSWLGGTDGDCRFCQRGRENLCLRPTYTGYSRHGGYAEFAVARTDFLTALPDTLEPRSVAPLLCAGTIGFRSLRVAEVREGSAVGLFGFGTCAQLMIRVLQHWKCEVYVSTRAEHHRTLARKMGATWVGSEIERPPRPLDAAITFAPSGQVVLAALRSLDKGGIVAINAIHLDCIPQFDYDSVLWGERQLRSVTNMIRDDVRQFFRIVEQIHLEPRTTVFPLERAPQALEALDADALDAPAVLVPGGL